MRKKLGNPAAVAIASNPDTVNTVTKEVFKIREEATKTGKILLFTFAIGVAGYYLYGKFKDWQKQQFIEKNAHIPDVQAAMIFRKAMFKVEPFSIVFTFITIPDGTDEATLNALATKVSSIENVIKAYKVLFESNLITDIYAELTNKELQKFFDRLNSKTEYDQGFGTGGTILPQTPFRAGQTLVVKNPQGCPVYEAVETANGTYQKGSLLGYKKYGDTLGTVEKIYKATNSPQHFYVIDRYLVVDTIFGYGWVQHTDVKLQN